MGQISGTPKSKKFLPTHSQLTLLDEAASGTFLPDSPFAQLKDLHAKMEQSEMIKLLLQELSLLDKDTVAQNVQQSSVLHENPNISKHSDPPQRPGLPLNPALFYQSVTPFVATQYPKIAFFSGDEGKGEVLYRQ